MQNNNISPDAQTNIAHEVTQGPHAVEPLKKGPTLKQAGIVLTCVILFVIAAASLGTSNQSSSNQVQTISQDQIDISIQTISAYQEVLDAAVTQDRDRVSLVLIVDDSVSLERAQELGDNFVRQVKLHGQDTAPGKEIGTGAFSYQIGIYTPDEEVIALGVKSALVENISW